MRALNLDLNSETLKEWLSAGPSGWELAYLLAIELAFP
jgi:hypothetical protein